MKKNIFQLTENYLKYTGLEPISRILTSPNTQAMGYEFDNCEDALEAASNLLEMICGCNLRWVEVHCQIRDNKHFVTIEELDPDEFEEEDE